MGLVVSDSGVLVWRSLPAFAALTSLSVELQPPKDDGLLSLSTPVTLPALTTLQWDWGSHGAVYAHQFLVLPAVRHCTWASRS